MHENTVASGLAGVIAAETRVSHVDGEQGRLNLAGYELEDIAPSVRFEEMLHLLWFDRLPGRGELGALRKELAARRELPARVVELLRRAAESAVEPMDALRMGTSALAAESGDWNGVPNAALRIVASLPTIVGTHHRLRSGEEPVGGTDAGWHAEHVLRQVLCESAVSVANGALCARGDEPFVAPRRLGVDVSVANEALRARGASGTENTFGPNEEPRASEMSEVRRASGTKETSGVERASGTKETFGATESSEVGKRLAASEAAEADTKSATDADVRPTRVLETYLNTVIDHGLNASTFTARVIVSTRSDFVSALTGALGALKGPLHGGAPGPALDMVFEIGRQEDGSLRFDRAHAERVLRAKLERGERLMGFGHRVYRVRDPRADVLARAARQLYGIEDGGVAARRLRGNEDTGVAAQAGAVASAAGGSRGRTRGIDAIGVSADPQLYNVAREVEGLAIELLEEYKPGRGLQTNVEFYTALLLHGLGLPVDLFTPVFAMGRVGGWVAHGLEQARLDRLIRPRARYVGATGRRLAGC